MSKISFTAKRRAEIASGWASSGLPQRRYAREHGISDRTLRQWIAQFVLPRSSSDAVRQAIRKTISELERVLAAFDLAACRAEGVNENTTEATDEKYVHSADENSPASLPTASGSSSADVHWDRMGSPIAEKANDASPLQRTGAFVYDW